MLHNMLRAAAGRDRVSTDGLIAHYTMDNISGSTLFDEQGTYDGTITGATQVAGVIGQALSFDGNDFVDLGTKFDFIHQTGAFTWNTWVLLDNYNDGNLYSFAGNTLTGSEHGFFFCYEDRTGSGEAAIRVVIFKGVNGSPVVDLSIDNAQPASGYAMVTVQGDGSSVEVYLGNTFKGSATYGTFGTGTAVRNATIGKGNFSTTGIDEWVGDIDETIVYNRALTSSERQTLLDRGA